MKPNKANRAKQLKYLEIFCARSSLHKTRMECTGIEPRHPGRQADDVASTVRHCPTQVFVERFPYLFVRLEPKSLRADKFK
jgi:hypothetical protein